MPLFTPMDTNNYSFIVIFIVNEYLTTINKPLAQFGYHESNASQVQQLVPEGLNGIDFFTTKFRYHTRITNKKANKKANKVAKCMIDLSSLKGDTLVFHPNNINPHMPLKTKCRATWFCMENKESPFVTYHYSGSWEQWDYRNDFRSK
jgi:hypothetical protein